MWNFNHFLIVIKFLWSIQMCSDPRVPLQYRYIERICCQNHNRIHRFWRASIAFFHWSALCFASSKDMTFFGCIITKYVLVRSSEASTLEYDWTWKSHFTGRHAPQGQTYRANLKKWRASNLNAEIVGIVGPYYIPLNHQLCRVHVDQLWFVGENKLYFFAC